MTRTSISQSIWWHPVSDAVSLEKPIPNKNWEQFDSIEEFKCFNSIKRAIHQKDRFLTLTRQKSIVLLESPLIKWNVDFALEFKDGDTTLIEYKGDWIRSHPCAELLLNYQMSLIERIGIKFILVSKRGNLLPKNHRFKSREISLRIVESTVRNIVAQKKNEER